jgi:hypothetical protein
MYLTIRGKYEATKRCGTITVRKCLPGGPSGSGQFAIRKTSVWISGILLYLMYGRLLQKHPVQLSLGLTKLHAIKVDL